MKLEQLIKVAKKGAVLSHGGKLGQYKAKLDKNQLVFTYGARPLWISDYVFDNRWQIETPHPGACTECKGLGFIPVKNLVTGDPTENMDCQHCSGTGDEPTPKPSPVLTVRIKGCSDIDGWYKDEVGEVYEGVLDSGLSGYYLYPGRIHIKREDCEVIPPYDTTKLILMARDEDRLKGDLFFRDGEWFKLTIDPFERKQSGDYVYIRPIKPATPDPSADCLPGFEAVEVSIYQGNLYYKSPECGGLVLEIILREPRWSGRYGYIIDGYSQIWWSNLPRRIDGQVPNYVEMKKEKP